MEQVFNPSIPYWGSIPSGLHIGKTIEIIGQVPAHPKRFQINLSADIDNGRNDPDLPLHISVRFDDKVVVRNTYDRHRWGSEERFGVFPFAKNSEFIVAISVNEGSFTISINGQNFCEFAHRLAFTSAKFLNITGNVAIRTIRFYQSGTNVPHPGPSPFDVTQPAICPPGPPNYFGVPQPAVCPPAPPSYFSERATAYAVGDPFIPPLMNPYVPLSHPLGSGIHTGQMIFIDGKTPVYAKSFSHEDLTMAHSNSSSLSHIVYNLKTPCWKTIPNNMHIGNMIEIIGYVPYDSDRFVVDLVAGKTKRSNVALHISVRFAKKCVVFNTKVNGSYGLEEICKNLPISIGDNFTLTVFVQEKTYQIAVNKHHLFDFEHRLDYSLVTDLHIYDDVYIKSIRFYENGLSIHPSIGPNYSGRHLASVRNPDVPYYQRIPEGMHVGKLIETTGRIPNKSERFIINFVINSKGEIHIALHINIRFDQGCIVRNSLINNSYGPEERDGILTISTGKYFKIAILVEDRAYKIAVNNFHFCDYEHRLDYRMVTDLYINGDVYVKSVTYFETDL